jgi:hypothetical protein
MMKKILTLMVISALTLTLVNCSDRELPLDADQPAGLYFSFGFTSAALSNNVMEDFPVREILVYTPPVFTCCTATEEIIIITGGFTGWPRRWMI